MQKCFSYKAGNYRVHHCCSQGMPSPSPSILTPGQDARKYLASAQDVIWEQYLRPSHRNDTAGESRQTADPILSFGVQLFDCGVLTWLAGWAWIRLVGGHALDDAFVIASLCPCSGAPGQTPGCAVWRPMPESRGRRHWPCPPCVYAGAQSRHESRTLLVPLLARLHPHAATDEQ